MKTPEKVFTAIGLALLCSLGAYALLTVLARRAYARCEQIELPTSFAILEQEFGAPVNQHARPSDTVEFWFNPVPLYWEIASGYINATTHHGATTVTSLHCGEGL